MTRHLNRALHPVSFDGQDSPPFLAYVEDDKWNGFEVAWVTLADLLAVTLDGGVTLFDDTLDAYLAHVPGEGIFDVTNMQSVPLESRVINGETHYRMDGYTITREIDEERAYRVADFFDQARAARDDVAAGAYPSLSPTPTLTCDAIEALSILLDVNDDDDIMLDAGVPAEGLAILREIAGTR